MERGRVEGEAPVGNLEALLADAALAEQDNLLPWRRRAVRRAICLVRPAGSFVSP